MNIPSAYAAGYEAARARDPQLAEAYVRHTTVGDPLADAVIRDLGSLSPEEIHETLAKVLEGPETSRHDVPNSLLTFVQEAGKTPDWFDGRRARVASQAFLRNSDIVHVWRYAGILFGIPGEILFSDEASAVRTFEIGRMCEPPTDHDGIIMANSVVNSAPIIVGIKAPPERRKMARTVTQVSRELIGDELADSLRFPRRKRKVVPWLRFRHRARRMVGSGRGRASRRRIEGEPVADGEGLDDLVGFEGLLAMDAGGDGLSTEGRARAFRVPGLGRWVGEGGAVQFRSLAYTAR